MGLLSHLWQQDPTKVCEDTVSFHFSLYCPKCKTKVRVDIAQLKMTVSK